MRKRPPRKSVENKSLTNLEVKWLNNYASLKEFKKLHKNIHVAVEYKKSYPVLYRWVKRQRELWAEGKLNPERMEMLNKISFIWNVKDLIWDKFYDKTKAYYDKHGNILMSEKFREKNKALGVWVNHQREYWLHDKHLTNEKIRKLKAIGFTKPNYRNSWNNKFELLKQFCQKNNHLAVAKNAKLNRWSIGQRNKRKDGLLSKEHIKQLNAIGFVWKIRKEYRTKKRLGAAESGHRK